MYKCNDCGHTQEKMLFKCSCGSTNIEEIESIDTTYVDKGKIKKKKITKKHDFGNTSVKDITVDSFKRLDTGLEQLNKVFGTSEVNNKLINGIAQNSLTLISGEPGVGKSTLLLQLIDFLSKTMKCSYISAEENQSQIKSRYERLKCEGDFDILHETNYALIEEFIFEKDSEFIIIDSINTIFSDGAGTIGGVSQIKENTMKIMKLAKKYNKTIVLIGQVSKDGDLAGPKILEHMVDSYFHMEAFDERNVFKILNSIKNRFGLINENVIFKMSSKGLEEVIDSSSIFMEEEHEDIGTSLSLIFKGQRPIFIEVESLVVDTNAEKSLIQASGGIDSKRYFQYLAILNKHIHFNTMGKNVFSNISGGISLKHKENVQLDLAIIASILSSEYEVNIRDFIFIGEVSLSGSIKKVPNEEVFIEHIKKMGIEKDIISNSTGYTNISSVLSHII